MGPTAGAEVTLPRIASALWLIGLVGCGLVDPSGSSEGPQPGVLLIAESGPAIEIPDRIQAGDSVQVVVYTKGFCSPSAGVAVSGPHRTDAFPTEEGVEIRPIDMHTRVNLSGGAACTGEIRLIRHEVRLPSDSPGTLTVRVVGQDWPSREEVVVVREVEVEPATETDSGV